MPFTVRRYMLQSARRHNSFSARPSRMAQNSPPCDSDRIGHRLLRASSHSALATRRIAVAAWAKSIFLICFVLAFLFGQTAFAVAPATSDVNSDGKTNAVDIELVINTALGISAWGACDVNNDGVVNAVDVQYVINAVIALIDAVLAPDLSGMSQADAEAAIADAGLAVGVVTEVYDAVADSGTVVGQAPVGGSSVFPNSAVNLVVSKGPQPVGLPNVVGMLDVDAKETLASASLAVGMVTLVYDSAIAAGNVISQTPAAGTSVLPGSAVDLVVSQGPQPVDVPDVMGLTQSSAKSAIANANLGLGGVTTAYSATAPAGIVISQDPSAGTSVPPGSAVNLVVSQGPQPIGLPNVVGMTQADAETAIATAGLVVGAVTQAYSASVLSGNVISQDPAAAMSVLPGSAVNLVVSKGPQPVEVPDVAGMAQADAETAISASGLAVGAVTQAFSASVVSGNVISQAPSAGTTVLPGVPVSLVVSKGPQPVDVPDVVGMTQVNAQSALTAAGLAAGTVTPAYSATIPVGSVVSQDPAGGSSAAPGSAVNLDISKGPEPPSIVSFTINGGAPDVLSQTVTLDNTCSGDPDLYMASEDPEFSDATWLSYSTAPEFTLSAGNGPKTIYLKVMNSVGVSDPVSATISLVAGKEETILLPGSVPLVMVWIPAGTFMMGRYPGEQDSSSNESPQHQVKLSHGFWMGKYAVTQAQWVAVMGSNPSHFTGDSRPVEQVSWNNAQTFITALNAATGQSFRLPSEAEWEYACRAGSTTRFHWGDDPTYAQINDYAWFHANSGAATHDVGGLLPNAWGLYDMNGNVWEWCQDVYGGYTSAAALDPSGPATGSYRVLRGGAFYLSGYFCRSAYRFDVTPSSASSYIGFRLAR